MSKIAIIGSSVLPSLSALPHSQLVRTQTPWGKPATGLIITTYHDREILFLPRHGNPHTCLPHQINYRANLWVLKQHQVSQIIAINTVGGISSHMAPGTIVMPDQIIDYTWGREHSYANGQHVDFTYPYHEPLRQRLLQAAAAIGLAVESNGVYAATQGPRLESKAEIDKLARDGSDIVGMTGMPEAGLARELDIAYACCALVVNWAAGRSNGAIDLHEIEKYLPRGMQQIADLLDKFLSL